MADFILIWNPLWPASSQNLYYREQGESVWLDLDTVDRMVDTYRAEGLQDNTVYEFQVEDVISSGNILSNIDEAIVMVCSDLNLELEGTTLSYSFSPIGEDIDTYKVQLFKNGISQSVIVYNSPFSDPITGSFTNLIPLETYKIRLVVASSVGGEKGCEIELVPQISCPKATNITGTIS